MKPSIPVCTTFESLPCLNAIDFIKRIVRQRRNVGILSSSVYTEQVMNAKLVLTDVLGKMVAQREKAFTRRVNHIAWNMGH